MPKDFEYRPALIPDINTYITHSIHQWADAVAKIAGLSPDERDVLIQIHLGKEMARIKDLQGQERSAQRWQLYSEMWDNFPQPKNIERKIRNAFDKSQ